jgi:hypothetical protein
MGIVSNIKKRGLKDLFNPSRWRIYIQHLRETYITGIRIGKKDAFSFAEQLLYRKSQCSDCFKAGACLHCGCEINGLMTTSSAECSAGRWGKMLKTKEWERLKESFQNFEWGFYLKDRGL